MSFNVFSVVGGGRYSMLSMKIIFYIMFGLLRCIIERLSLDIIEI